MCFSEYGRSRRAAFHLRGAIAAPDKLPTARLGSGAAATNDASYGRPRSGGLPPVSQLICPPDRRARTIFAYSTRPTERRPRHNVTGLMGRRVARDFSKLLDGALKECWPATEAA